MENNTLFVSGDNKIKLMIQINNNKQEYYFSILGKPILIIFINIINKDGNITYKIEETSNFDEIKKCFDFFIEYTKGIESINNLIIKKSETMDTIVEDLLYKQNGFVLNKGHFYLNKEKVPKIK